MSHNFLTILISSLMVCPLGNILRVCDYHTPSLGLMDLMPPSRAHGGLRGMENSSVKVNCGSKEAASVHRFGTGRSADVCFFSEWKQYATVQSGPVPRPLFD